MLPFKSHLIICATALIVGLCAGYSIRDEKADLDRLEQIQAALQTENENLVKQLEQEHEYQKAAQAVAEQTQKDLAELEDMYADAVNELNDMQLQQLSYDCDDSSALSEDPTITESVSEETSKCTGYNKVAFQKLYEDQLKLAKDCDITASYYNRLIDLYNSIQE
jgi:uncharacterized protein YqfA (UPF0365 family)